MIQYSSIILAPSSGAKGARQQGSCSAKREHTHVHGRSAASLKQQEPNRSFNACIELPAKVVGQQAAGYSRKTMTILYRKILWRLKRSCGTNPLEASDQDRTKRDVQRATKLGEGEGRGTNSPLPLQTRQKNSCLRFPRGPFPAAERSAP